LNSKLSGVRGWRVTETDNRKREVVWLRDQDVEPHDGYNVVLTLDAVVQNILETALAEGMEKHSPISISGMVIRPRTGAILAMATLPTFDPNSPGASVPDSRRNRVIADLVEPGSTFKIVVVSGGLNERKMTLKTVYDCERGAFVYGGRTLHDHDPYGLLTVEEIITKSSNIGAAKVGIALGQEQLYAYIRDFGFGVRTGIPLPGEVNGIVHPTDKWYKVSLAQIPMGHGVCVTPLQMAMAMAAIANNGALMRPMLVDRLQDQDGHVVAKYGPQKVRQVLSPETSRQMVQALKTVVTKDGTAPKAALEHYTVAGKTGTAQKVENGAYVRGKYISSFIGFFPADHPELCISIVLDQPKGLHYGGLTAAPVFRQVAERTASYLNIPPDRVEESGGPGVFEIGAEDRPVRTASAR
jgi:cell division protein FtsI/penicillin-binding protein 2